jgi:hypothetical protein
MFRLVFLLMLLLSGCTTTAIKQPGVVALTESSHYQLAKPPANMVGQGFLSLVKGQQGEEDYELLVQVEINPDSLVMVGTTVNGIELFELVWYENKPYSLKQSMLAKSIEVEYLLADFQLVHWPLALLNSQLTGAQVNQNQQKRVVKQGEKTIIDIHFNKDSIAVKNLARDYQLTISIVEKWTF